MRHQALTMGLTMNEHGLYKMDGKKKGDGDTKIDKAIFVGSTAELSKLIKGKE